MKLQKPKVLLLVEDEKARQQYQASLEASFELFFLPPSGSELEALQGFAAELIFMDSPTLGAQALPRLEGLRQQLRAKTYVATLLTTDAIDPALLEEASQVDVSCTRAQAAQQTRVLVKAALRIRATMVELLESNLKLGRASEKLKKLSLTDELTGLYNMRFMARQIRSEFKRAERYMKNLALILLEIDGFVDQSPTWGEGLSAQMITQLGQEIGDGIRFEVDYAARSGSADFMLVLPETDFLGSLKVAERMQKKVSSAQFQTENGPITLTVSIGIAFFNGQSKNLESPQELLRVAETGLKLAKAKGPHHIYAPQNDPSSQTAKQSAS